MTFNTITFYSCLTQIPSSFHAAKCLMSATFVTQPENTCLLCFTYKQKPALSLFPLGKIIENVVLSVIFSATSFREK